MKSAYELAMERLREEDPDEAVSLTDEQKQQLQEIETRFRAKIAEREVFLNKQLLEARKSGDASAVGQLQVQLRNERARLEEEMEKEKDKVRHAAREQ